MELTPRRTGEPRLGAYAAGAPPVAVLACSTMNTSHAELEAIAVGGCRALLHPCRIDEVSFERV